MSLLFATCRFFAALALAIFLPVLTAHAEDAAARCPREMDDKLRLLCYDRAFSGQAVVPAPVATKPVALDEAGGAASVMSKVWELGADCLLYTSRCV